MAAEDNRGAMTARHVDLEGERLDGARDAANTPSGRQGAVKPHRVVAPVEAIASVTVCIPRSRLGHLESTEHRMSKVEIEHLRHIA